MRSRQVVLQKSAHTPYESRIEIVDVGVVELQPESTWSSATSTIISIKESQ